MSLSSEQMWLVLFNLLTDLNNKGYEIPKEINSEMGLAKSSINVYKRDPSHPEMINSLAKADIAIANMQNVLLDIAEKEGEEYFKGWVDLINKASMGEEIYLMPNSNAHFIPNRPPGMSTTRITLKKPLAEERVQEIAEYNGVIIEFENDNTIVIHGDKKDVQNGVKEIGPFFKE